MTFNSSIFWMIFTIIISIVIVTIIIWIILYPQPVKYVLEYLYPKADYTPTSNALITNSYILYSLDGSLHRNLVVIFIGGSLLTSNVSKSFGLANYLHEQLGFVDYDILLFDYPVRFKYTLKQTMLAINEKLKDFVGYDNVHAIGISVGALLAGAFYRKETNEMASIDMGVPRIGIIFKTFTGLCGLYETTFNSELLTKLFRYYILSNTPSLRNYTCYGMSIPKLIISSRSDFLISQTVRYLEHEPDVTYKIYDSKTLPHAFQQYLNLFESRQSIASIAKFIQNSNEQPII